jgi:hypothetical protein
MPEIMEREICNASLAYSTLKGCPKRAVWLAMPIAEHPVPLSGV